MVTTESERTTGSTGDGNDLLIETSVTAGSTADDDVDSNHVIDVSDLDVFYAETQALSSVEMGISDRRVTALIGPSGCGKTTFLRCLNRMNDLVD